MQRQIKGQQANKPQSSAPSILSGQNREEQELSIKQQQTSLEMPPAIGWFGSGNATPVSNISGKHDFAKIAVFSRIPALIQPKLKINSPGDKYEQEADAMAEQVMRMPMQSSPKVHAAALTGLNIQRQCADCAAEEEQVEEKPALMRKAENNAGVDASPALATQLNTTKGGGSALPPETRRSMEQAFGTDFSAVRVHTDDRSAQMSQDIRARAFTHGRDIYFNSGEFAPEQGQGRRLLAHELTHVVQQGGAKEVQVGQGEKQGQLSTTAPAILRAPDDKESVSQLAGQMAGMAVNVAAGGIGAKVGKAIGAAVGNKIVDAMLKKAAESLVEIGGTADAMDTKVVVEELIKIPLIALTALKTKGVKVVVCRNSVTEVRTDLKGVRPRGWPEGKTWDTVPGLNDPSNNRVIIATRNGKVPPTGDGHGAVNLVLHEVGHAIGDAVTNGGITDPAFVAARDADKALLDSYEGQAGNAGVRETYAESFARFYAKDPTDATTYPNLHAYWATNPFVAKTK